jgi:TonB-dependent receptor
VTQPVNTDRETVSGVEFNLQTQFTSLPGFLGGFGVSANYTHVWGHATANAIRTGAIPLGYQSRDLGNVQLFFEKYGLSARLAFNYRSAYLDTLGGTAATDQYTDANGQLDLHVSYQVVPQVTVFGDAINLPTRPGAAISAASPTSSSANIMARNCAVACRSTSMRRMMVVKRMVLAMGAERPLPSRWPRWPRQPRAGTRTVRPPPRRWWWTGWCW